MRNIILTNKQTGETTIFSSLKPLFREKPEFLEVENQIDYCLSRKKIAYESSCYKIERKVVIN